MLRAVDRGEPRATYERLEIWLRAIGLESPTLASYPEQEELDMLADCIKKLESRLYAETTFGPEGSILGDPATTRRGLKRARRKLLDVARVPVSARALPPLNPR